jgi:hypothetical protein
MPIFNPLVEDKISHQDHGTEAARSSPLKLVGGGFENDGLFYFLDAT